MSTVRLRLNWHKDEPDSKRLEGSIPTSELKKAADVEDAQRSYLETLKGLRVSPPTRKEN